MDYEQEYNASLEQAKKELKTCGTLDCDAAKLIFRLFPQLRKEEEPLTPFQQCLNCILRGVYYAEVPDKEVNEFILNVVRTRTDELIKLAKRHEYADCQLHESKDERIRKTLVKYFKRFNQEDMWNYEVSLKDIVAYLEKHEELPFVKDVVLGLPGLYFYDGERMHFQGNPATEENPYDFAMSQQEQKPAWSEEDEENFKWFDKFFCAESIVLGGKDIPQDKYLWFKSLRPQPNWKPSEEQMGALERSVEYLEESDNEDADILAGLYEQLKKLM